MPEVVLCVMPLYSYMMFVQICFQIYAPTNKLVQIMIIYWLLTSIRDRYISLCICLKKNIHMKVFQESMKADVSKFGTDNYISMVIFQSQD